ncbi:MAG: class I SAM-dependent methyltransferase [Bdellovibrionota bacterium]
MSSEIKDPNRSKQESWQKQIYDARLETYKGEGYPTREGMFSLLLTFREHVRMLDRMKPESKDVFLDIGCSSGSQLELISSRFGCQGVGIDISSSAIEWATKRDRFGNKFLEGSAERRLPFADGSYDCVTCFDVIEHLENPTLALQEIFRVLRPGGRALFHIPVSDIRGSMDWICWTFQPLKWEKFVLAAGHDYTKIRTRVGYENLISLAGFSVAYSHRYNAFLQNIFDYHMVHRLLNRIFFVWKVPFTLYHRVVAPIIEAFIFSDRLLQKANIGASIYILARRPG